MNKYKLGDRVCAADEEWVGEEFRGLVGTVTQVGDDYYYVNFDDPPRWSVSTSRAGQGGGWGENSLEPHIDPVTEDEEAEAIRSIMGI